MSDLKFEFGGQPFAFDAGRRVEPKRKTTRGLKFYHASPRRFRHGQVLTGGHGGGAGYQHDNVCLTTNPEPHITIRASIAGLSKNEQHVLSDQDWYIYEVEPLTDPVYVQGNVEYQTKAARVLRLIGTSRAFVKRPGEGAGVALSPDRERNRTRQLEERAERKEKRRGDPDVASRPPSKSQIDYAKHLLKQVGADEPDWDKLDGIEVSTLIDALKKKRGKPVWYGNGQFSHWEKESGTKVVLATGEMSWSHARMTLRVAARYKEKKTVKNKDGEKRTVYVYSERQIALRNAEKARKVEHLKSSIEKIRAKVKKDIRSDDPAKKLTALAVALMDHTYERVGNDESAAERGHFGVTGWQRKHLSFGRGGVSISYTGKSGVKHTKKVSDEMIRKALRDAYEAVEDDDACIFEWEGGKVSAEKVNAYLEPFGVTAKDIRGFHANREMSDKLKEARKKGGELPTDKKERTKILKAEFKKALSETAEAVGHEAATLRSQYLIPGLEEQYTKNGTIVDKVAASVTAAEDERWMLAHSVVFRYLSSL